MIKFSVIRGALQSFLSSIPYDIQPEQERYYQTAVHLIFNFLGSRCRSEVRTANERIDSIVETEIYVYCFEFKLDGTSDEALQQINSKKYTLQWNNNGKKVYKVGVTFDSKKRNIGDWKIETV
ncbi:MAG: PD-(D/E)XK nuclease domain-containing protein [Planctomycetaceae bacterium]|nr:PD-(D/E)XK nuclease domain-containing protein [Planctomycetaceae bacterium]